MDTELLNGILVSARTAIMVATNITMMIILMNRMLSRKHSLFFLISWCAINTVVVKLFFNIILADYVNENYTFYIIYMIVVCVVTLFFVIPIIYTYEGTVGKVLVVQFISEFVSSIIGYVAMVLVNVLSGRAVLNYYAVISLWDFLIPVIASVLFVCVSKLFGRFFEKIKNLRIAYFSIKMYIVEILWIGGAIFSFVGSLESDVDYIFQLIFTFGLLGAVILLLDIYQTQTLQEHQYLRNQQKLLNMHYEAIGVQVAKIKKAQLQLSASMDTIMDIDVNKDSDNERLVSYLEGLKRQTEETMAGVYCNDWIVDSILFHNELLCKKCDIKTEYSFHNFDRGKITDEDISRILSHLLNVAVRSAKGTYRERRIVIETRKVKDQLIIRLIYNLNDFCRFNFKPIADCIKAYDGFVSQNVIRDKNILRRQIELKLQVD